MFFFPKKEPNKNAVSRSELESAITDAVKHSDPECESFVGVIVRKATPKSPFDANWTIRGVKFGVADRVKSLKAIDGIVERMQREFRLSDDQRAHGGESLKQSFRRPAN